MPATAPSSIYHATHHQAAHAVTAVMLGFPVERISVTGSATEENWGILEAGIEDIAAVCAAGFAMDRILGLNSEAAWEGCRNDRDLLSAIYADRTGMALADAELTDLFHRGVSSSESILRHQNVQRGIEAMAASLVILFDAGESCMQEEDIRRIVAPLIGGPCIGERQLATQSA